MPKIKVRCNGSGRHINEVDLDSALSKCTAVRGCNLEMLTNDIPERLVLKCRECAEGRVIIEKEMLESVLKYYE